jgi:hypothetical protein
MTSQEFSSKIKEKYPQYANMDDGELTQKIVQKYPQYKDQIDTDWKGVIGKSVKDIFQKPAAFAKDLGTNPQSMANAIPPLMSMAGGASPIPGGATMGMGAGQGIRDLALKTMNKPVPGMMQHGMELGGAALGDITAIPAMKRSHFGSQIGKAEKGAGVITRAPTKAVTPGSVGQTLNDLEAQIDAGTINTPQAAKDAKAVVSQIYKNPKIYEQTGEISVQSARVSKKVQDLLNKMILGREAPAKAMGQAMTIPNKIKGVWKDTPWAIKRGAQGAAGVLGVEELVRMLRGGR